MFQVNRKNIYIIILEKNRKLFMLRTVLGVAPGAMLFRDDKHTHFARKPITEEDCIRELEPKTMIRKIR